MGANTYEPPKHGWTCFHCGETFTTVGAARDHFGNTPTAEPGCVIDRVAVEEGGKPERGRGLLMALRRAEAELARYREEDTDLHRQIYRMQSAHNTALTREEEKGYARGLRDGVDLPADSPERASIAQRPKVRTPRKPKATPAPVVNECPQCTTPNKCGRLDLSAKRGPRCVGRADGPDECDCINQCGDDPWLEDGRAVPCASFTHDRSITFPRPI